MKRILLFIVTLLVMIPAGAEMTRQERINIKAGNEKYKEKKYKDARADYEKAYQANPNGVAAAYNLALTDLRLSESEQGGTAEEKEKFKQSGAEMMGRVAMQSQDPKLASLANYNLGNLAFKSENYGEAIKYYEQALRINPSDDNARHNLRVAQLKQNNDDNQDKDNKQDQQQQDQQDQQQNQPEDKNEPEKQEQEQQQLNPQAADQILQAMENKENATRQRLQNSPKRGENQNTSRRNW